MAELADKQINESSGLALSLRDPQVFWTVNDSGGEACVFAFDQSGKARGKVAVKDAFNFDWEDLGSGPGSDGKPALYVADIGDNLRKRPVVQIYEIPEPEFEAKESASAKVWAGIYPDGAHNAECLLVDPVSGALTILTKSEDGGSVLYAFPQKRQDVPMVLKRIGEVQFPAMGRPGKRPVDDCMATGSCISADRKRVVVSTYCHLLEWEIREGEPLATAMARDPSRILPPLTPQMEAICYDADNATLWFTSERLPTPLYRLRR
ncbi:MAG: hypothetical protein H7A55_13445 [Verrucomicrobiaceae bacterium]|nr:hypothetical protein [Verrucomicrobiaceae bacterium]